MSLVPIAFAILAILVVYRILRTHNTLKDVPGPTPSNWFLGYVYDLSPKPVGTLYREWSRTFGQTYKLRGPLGVPELVVGDPKGATHILNSPSFQRNYSDRVALEEFFGDGVFNAEGEHHKRQRAVLNTAFSPSNVREVAHVLFDLAERLTQEWEEEIRQAGPSGILSEITSKMQRVAIDAISMTTFSYTLSEDPQIPALIAKIADVPASTLTLIAESLVDAFPILYKVPSPMRDWTVLLRTELGKIADRIWKENEKSDGGGAMHSKLLDAMGSSKMITGEPMDRDTAIANMCAVIFAGYETTANILAECLYELAQKPSIQDKLRTELNTFVDTTGREPTYDDLTGDALPYLDAVSREAMRTKAVLLTVTRAAVASDTIPLHFPVTSTGATHVVVEPGQLVHVPVRDGIHVDSVIWGPDAEEFRPERWLEGDSALPEMVKMIRAPGHLLTFGDGPKTCLGRYFAMAEFKIVISTIIRRFRIEDVEEKYDFYRQTSNTIKPRIRGREHEAPQLNLRVKLVEEM
ncbi:cytochrome P450 [Rhodofomes roseus]|uniref:Cytochrome P450 n=1 Tax=Rhodofomes roseus TaxID=34475 RepID=A0ABQ8K1Q3_9APHY|nr:cytochrome P450 [Rhodofomes roseus]KAH9830594.1 cytochrome P450 [Rhodofomes roseus]